MIDFHSHVLPGVDDGAENADEALAMLRESRRQGVEIVCATPHFYADEEDPRSFLQRRSKAWGDLRRAMEPDGIWPELRLGAEVLYFPGMSVSEELRSLCLEGTPLLLIEPPMAPWTETMLEEIEECGANLRCVPVIAHVDRYMRMLEDDTLLDRALRRRVLVQFNASAFLRGGFREKALARLRAGQIHFLGSDCHDMSQRRPNLGDAAEAIREEGLEKLRQRLNDRSCRALGVR